MSRELTRESAAAAFGNKTISDETWGKTQVVYYVHCILLLESIVDGGWCYPPPYMILNRIEHIGNVYSLKIWYTKRIRERLRHAELLPDFLD